MTRQLKQGAGWRIGWDDDASEFKGLIGSDEWALELTEAELADFCRLISQLAHTMNQLASELMDEEKISCEAESHLLWLEADGFPHTYSLRVLVLTGRRSEGFWPPEAVPDLVRASQMLNVF